MKLKTLLLPLLFAGNIFFARQSQIGSIQKPEIIKRNDSFEKILIKNL